MKALTKATIVIMLASSAQAPVFAQALSTPAASVSVQDREVVAVEPLVPATPIGENNKGQSRPVLASAWASERSTAGAVLVIPSTDMKSEDILAIMEDTSIMSRIFDKSLSQQRLITPGTGTFDSLYSSGPFAGGPIFTSPRGYATEAMYLQGFGSLFFIGVDFPLSPPSKVQQDKPDEGVDTVWTQTKREIYSPGDISRRAKGQPQKEYDAERVEDLQKTLVKTLKHAANIRGLKTDEWVTVVVRSSAPAVLITGTIVTRSTIETSPAASDPSASTRTGVRTSSATLPVVEQPGQATFLTIRAKKSDIDSFAKDQLNYDQFRQRVQTVKY